MRNWKTVGDDGGVLGNFISHCFHYLEWFCGPITGLSARVSGLPDDEELETTVAMAIQLAAGPLVSLSMSCASFLGAGHKLEFFGEDGTLVLHNPSADYMSLLRSFFRGSSHHNCTSVRCCWRLCEDISILLRSGRPDISLREQHPTLECDESRLDK